MGAGPYVARIVRVSPPELAREFPGPQASMRVTRPPLGASWSPDQPPNAPAPTTITEDPADGSAGERSMQAAPTSVELFRKLRRELFGDMVTPHVAAHSYAHSSLYPAI